MERDYRSHGFKIIEMPYGKTISTERFSEFQISLDYYRNTKAFEDDLQNRLLENTKPVVLLEGETDPIYIKSALELLGFCDILEQINIDWVGAWKGSQSFNTGDTGLNNTSKVLKANPQLLKHKLLLLYDSDTNKEGSGNGLLLIRKIPKNTNNTKIKKGIENLLPMNLFEDRFYKNKTKVTDYAEKHTIQEFQKMDFCKWICEERRNADDFLGFSEVIEILKSFLGIKASSASNSENPS